MTSPNEPERPGQRDGSGNGSGQALDRPSPEPLGQQEPRSGGLSPGVEARRSSFISSTVTPGAPPASETGYARATPLDSDGMPVRQENPHAEAYGSELPDLSGPPPRPVQRMAAPDDARAASGRGGVVAAGSRIQVARRTRGPVRASMQIRRIDPWSTLKVSLLLSVALFFVWMIAVAFLYLVLGGMGVWSKLNSNVGDLLDNSGGGGELVSGGSVFGAAALIGLTNVVLLTAMATIGAFVYNLTTDLVGGVEVTLADRD